MPFELIPHKLVFGGKALGYHQGRPVLVSQGLPGERLEVEPVGTAKGVVHARLVRVLEPSAQRVTPPCPYFGRCGGCQYQHLGLERQGVAKREILRETLRRIGKIIWNGEIRLHAAQPWNYRNQAQLKVTRQPDGRIELGFFEAESHRLFPIDTCLILSPRLNALLKTLREPEWSIRLGEYEEVGMLADDHDEHVMLTLRGRLEPKEAEALAADCLDRLPGVATVAVEQGRNWRVFGTPALRYSVGEFQYQVSPGSFFQASRFLLPELVAGVTSEEPDRPKERGLSGAVRPGRRALALDLFAGVGLFTLPLAQHFEWVIAVEANARAAADLEANVGARSLQNVRVVAQPVLDFLRRFAQAEPDLVVLDPPRAGVGIGILKLLAALRPQRVHYVSCSPPTLARDLALLVARGYQLNSVELFDFFPQTYHLECLAKLTRIDRPA
jgi:23S rRNA (uracil1939-C5)-methyltransferase